MKLAADKIIKFPGYRGRGTKGDDERVRGTDKRKSLAGVKRPEKVGLRAGGRLINFLHGSATTAASKGVACGLLLACEPPREGEYGPMSTSGTRCDVCIRSAVVNALRLRGNEPVGGRERRIYRARLQPRQVFGYVERRMGREKGVVGHDDATCRLTGRVMTPHLPCQRLALCSFFIACLPRDCFEILNKATSAQFRHINVCGVL